MKEFVIHHSIRRGGFRLHRGSVYMIVLAASMMVTVIGLASLFAVRVQRRSVLITKDCAEARLCAQSAIELGLLTVQDPNWRDNKSNGIWLSNQPLGDGHLTLEGIDPDDGVLNDSDTDPLVLTGTGEKGFARQRIQVKLTADTTSLNCLEVALHGNGSLNFNRPTELNCNQTISANNSVNESKSTINTDVEAVNAINGIGYTGTITTGIAPRAMPDAVTVFDHYTGQATAINILSLPASMDETIRYLQDVVLSPTNNPYGATDPEGIYKIDCLGVSLNISDCRIVGTLVLVNPGSATGIYKPVNWEPAIDNYPSLLVNGAFYFKIFTGQLDEVSRGVNFNPAGTPYQGDEDSVLDDVYPSEINGLVYIAGDAECNSSFTTTTINGVLVVGGSLTITPSSNKDPAYLNLTYDPKYCNNPPLGFEAPVQMKISSGSYKQVVD